MPNFNWMEIAIIAVVALLLFGGRKIPQLARDLGAGIREFKDSLTGASQPADRDSNREAPAQLADESEYHSPASTPRRKKAATRRKRSQG